MRVISREWGLKLVLIGGMCAWLALLAATWAEGAEPGSLNLANDDYDFRWLDPDKKIYVLQNRRYTKAHHILISAMGGIGNSNAYRTTFVVDPRIAFYFSESLGIEAFFGFSFNSSNNLYAALKDANPNNFPVTRDVVSQFGGLLHWVPWYAKINFFNLILYFDWYLSAGAGSMNTKLITESSGSITTVDQALFAGYIGTGHQYRISQNFIVRLDFMGTIYPAPIYGNRGATAWFTNYQFSAGVGLSL